MSKLDWWKEAVIYQIYPRSFQDTNGDGIGDLMGITQRLDYVASLGVDGIWISPFFTSPMNDYGYDVADYTGIDPMFGHLADFDALVDKAHQLGLKVIIDQVLSHSSDQHAWFKESASSRDNPKADWYVWADAKPDGSPPNNWLSIFGGVGWEWAPLRQQYYLHNFLKSQPDLNFHCEDMMVALLETSRFWLERGVDGFRLDVCNYYSHDPELKDNPPKDPSDPTWNKYAPYSQQEHKYDKIHLAALPFHRRLRALTDEYGATMMVGEVGADDPLQVMADYTSEPGPLHTCYSFALLDRHVRAQHVAPTVQEFFGRAPEGWPSWSLSNHDVMRAVSRFAGQRGRDEPIEGLASALNALLFALPGTLFFYQGEELGLPEAHVPPDAICDPVGRDGCRTPMVWDAAAANAGFSDAAPWLPIPEAHIARSVSEQQRDDTSVLAETRALLKFRNSSETLRNGSFRFRDAPKDCIALERSGPDGALFIVVNLGPDPQSIELPVDNASAQVSRGVELGKGKMTLTPYSYGYFAI